MPTCIPAGWGSSWGGATGWGDGSITTSTLPVNDIFDVFCIGPCGDMAGIEGFSDVALADDFYVDVDAADLVLRGSNTESSAFIATAVSDVHTLEYIVSFSGLPLTLNDPATDRVFAGVRDQTGASVGLFFSQSGIGYGAGLGEKITAIPNTSGIISLGKYWTVRVVVNKNTNSVFIYLTDTDVIASGRGHSLLCIVPIPGQTLSLDEGFICSVRGTPQNPLEMRLHSVCLSSLMLVPNIPPVADAGMEQEVKLRTFARLDGTSSYDPDGSNLQYSWRLIDAPAGSSYVLECYDGVTPAHLSGFTSYLYSTELLAANAEAEILQDDVVVCQGKPYRVISKGSDVNGFYVVIDGAYLAASKDHQYVKLLRQQACLPNKVSAKPVFYPDRPGHWSFDLTVFDGELYSLPSVTVVTVTESPVPRGITPDMSFIWSHLSTFWSLLEDPEPIEAVWSAIGQIASSALLTLWQVDYNKSLRDIQRTLVRKWLYYDLLMQEPFPYMTSTAKLTTASGYVSGVSGVVSGPHTYTVPINLAGAGVVSGDHLILAGVSYRIQKVSAGTDSVITTYIELPTGVTTWKIAKPTKSAQLDFWKGLVSIGDTCVVEVITKSSGQVAYFLCPVLGVCEEVGNELALDPTLVKAYVGNELYDVFLGGVFRRTYAPINERIKDIPYLQSTIKSPKNDEVLRRNVDFFLEEFRGLPCIRFGAVWYSEVTTNGIKSWEPDATPPVRLWAEFTHIENLSVVEANFGILADLTLEDISQMPEQIDYLSAVKGIWYCHINAATPYNLRVGAQILCGLPFAEEEGVYTAYRDDLLDPHNRLYLTDTSVNGIVREYRYHKGLALQPSTKTGQFYKIGDTIPQFTPLTTGIDVIDYVKDPEWFRPWLLQGAMSEVEKYFKFLVRIDSKAFTLPTAMLIKKHMMQLRPQYTYPMVVGTYDADLADINVTDTVVASVKVSLYEGTCFNGAFGHATMWDQPAPSVVKDSLPPGGGSVQYTNVGIDGIASGWMSRYDVKDTHTSSTELQLVQTTDILSVPAIVGTSAATGTNRHCTWIQLRAETTLLSNDSEPMYELIIRAGGAKVATIPFTGTLDESNGIRFFAFGRAVDFTIPSGSNIEVSVVAASGYSPTPCWETTTATLTFIESTTAPDVPWGYDDHYMCPEEELAVALAIHWATEAVVGYDQIFAHDLPVYPAQIINGTISLDFNTPIAWSFGQLLAASPTGMYGRLIIA